MQFFPCPWELLRKDVQLLLYLVPKRRGLVTLEQGKKKKKITPYLSCQDSICFALLEGRQAALIDYKYTLHGFGKKTCPRKCASVNKPLCFVITPPIPQPFKTRHRL